MKSPNPKDRCFDNPNYEKWIKTLPCMVCGNEGVDPHHVWHARRNCYSLVPLCRTHHTFGKDSYHALELDAFEAKHRITLDWVIMNQLSRYIHKLEKIEIPFKELSKDL